MNTNFKRYFFITVAVIAFAIESSLAAPEAKQVGTNVEVWAMSGSATISAAGSTSAPVKLGTVVMPGSVISTSPGSAVDLYLGSRAGVLRLTANTVVALEKFNMETSEKDQPLEVQLDLREGTVLGSGNKLPAGSKYQFRLSNGVAGVVNGDFRLNAKGYVVLLKGKLVFVFVPSSGEPTPYTLNAPPAAYFSPVEGIKQAPPALVREVQNQIDAKLRSK